MLALINLIDYIYAMSQVEAFLGARDALYEQPAEIVRLAASALLEISFLRDDAPAKLKQGLPVFRHQIPIGESAVSVLVKPHKSHFLQLKSPKERANAAGLPASLLYSNGIYRDVAFSFVTDSDLVAVNLGSIGDSSTTEPGRNAIRNVWRNMHKPMISYVQQSAAQPA